MPWQRKLQCWRPNAQMTFFPWKQAKDRVPLDRGARRSKVGRRSLCSQDANDRFWHEPEVLASATTSSHFGGQTDVHLATLDRQVVTPSGTNVVIRYPCAEPD